jgi:protein CpxP
MKSVIKMKRLRAAALLLCSAGLVASAAVAQQDAPMSSAEGQQQASRGAHGMDQQHHMAMMQQQLGLDADQMAKIKTIMADGRAKMDALRANTSLAPEDRRTQIMAIRKENMAKVRAVLTPDQQTKLGEMRARRRANRSGGMRGDAPAAPQSLTPAPQ